MSLYFDYNSSTPTNHEVMSKVTEAMEKLWKNPSGIYSTEVKNTLDNARETIATTINCNKNGVIFTSSGTEANAIMLNTFIQGSDCKLPHIITTGVEHSSISVPLTQAAQEAKISLTTIPADAKTGAVDPEAIVSAIREHQTVLVTVMLANNETGAVMPIKAIVDAVRSWEAQGSRCKLQRIFIHTDAAQAFGKIPVDMRDLGVDYLTLVGQKFYGPKASCLCVRKLRPFDYQPTVATFNGVSPDGPFCPLLPLVKGGGQEFGYRAGTENIPMIAGLAKAVELAHTGLASNQAQLLETRTYLESQLQNAFPKDYPVKLSIFGLEPSPNDTREIKRLPNTVHVSFIGPPWLDSKHILALSPNLEVSRGAACSSRKAGLSKALLATGFSPDQAKSALRLSIGLPTSRQEVDGAVDTLRRAVDMCLNEDAACD